jgi:hypothetical protein
MIIDENGNRITSFPMTDAPGVNEPFHFFVNCQDGFELSAAFDDGFDDPNTRIWAKAAPGDAFQNLHTTPLDLSPYAGTVRTIYCECRAASNAIKQTAIVNLLVARPT